MNHLNDSLDLFKKFHRYSIIGGYAYENCEIGDHEIPGYDVIYKIHDEKTGTDGYVLKKKNRENHKTTSQREMDASQEQ